VSPLGRLRSSALVHRAALRRKTSRRGGWVLIRNRCPGGQHPGQKFALVLWAHGQFNTKAEAESGPPSPRISFKHHFHSVQILASFRLVGDHRQSFSKSFRLQALPSLRHSSFAFCKMSSDIGLAALRLNRTRAPPPVQSNRREESLSTQPLRQGDGQPRAPGGVWPDSVHVRRRRSRSLSSLQQIVNMDVTKITDKPLVL
jgi:hypothetical protein